MSSQSQPVDLRLLSKVSKLYYEQHLTQQVIADRLQLSRPKVSRLLQQAHAQGIIQITVVSPFGIYTDMEQQLEQRYQLKEALVVEVDRQASPEAIARELGIATAHYLQRTLTNDDIIGVSWGTTLNAMANALTPMEVHNTHVVQIIGGLGAPEAEIHATHICRRLAHMLNSRLTLIAAPGIVPDFHTKQALLSDSHTQQAFDLFADLTLALVGIGVPLPSSVVVRDGSILTQTQLDELLERVC